MWLYLSLRALHVSDSLVQFYQLWYTAPKRRSWWWTKESETCRALNPLNAELNPIRHLLALVGARHIVRVSRIRVNDKERHIIGNCVSSWSTNIHIAIRCTVHTTSNSVSCLNMFEIFNPLNAELNPICHLLALGGAHHFVHVSRVRVNSFRRNLDNT